MNDQFEGVSRGKSLLGHYREVLSSRRGEVATGEGTLERETPAFDASTIDERLEASKSELYRIVEMHLGGNAELYEVVDRIAANGREGLAAVGAGDENRIADPEILAGLEVIVRADGTRPSFMVRNGMPDLTTSPIGTWRETFEDEPEMLRSALSCVGRIDDQVASQGFHGTAWLLSENLVMTNRHVLQGIASQDPLTSCWKLKPDITIDFGHEFRGLESAKRRKIKRVVFAGSDQIDLFSIEHTKLDLALLELEPASAAERPDHALAFDPAPDWGRPQRIVLIIGYPGDPGVSAGPPSLLELLFKSTFGCKRVAPGYVSTIADKLPDSPRGWTLGHDATTLGGNSGSAVVLLSHKQNAVGLHFGGRRADPRENWCHVLGRTLEQTDGRSPKTLRTVLLEHGVDIKNQDS